MDIAPPEHRTIQVTYGTDSSKASPIKGLHQVAYLRPFTQQELFPASDSLRDKLSQLTTAYKLRRWGLAAFADFAAGHVQKTWTGNGAHSDIIALGKPGPLDDDVWCVDTRGCLTLAVGKTAYQRLGLVGKPLPWREHEDTYIIRISLLKEPLSLKNEQCHAFNSKVKAALEAWDQRHGPWDIIYHHTNATPQSAEEEITSHKVEPATRTLDNVMIPNPTLREGPRKDADDEEDWNEKVGELLEWVGLACLGSSRLKATNRCDPYIAVYTPPTSSSHGDLTHIRWKGLLSAAFVQSVVDIAATMPFACIVANSIPVSPVTVVPQRADVMYPRRAPRRDSEDAWCLVITTAQDDATAQWIMAESVGQWDSRWG